MVVSLVAYFSWPTLYNVWRMSSSTLGQNWPTLQHGLSAIGELLVCFAAELFCAMQTLISEMVQRRPVKTKVYQWLGRTRRCRTKNWLIYFIHPSPNFHRGQKCEIWHRFSTLVDFESVWFRNGTTYRNTNFTLETPTRRNRPYKSPWKRAQFSL